MPKQVPEKPMPAIIWIHGGGWNAGSHKDNAAASMALKGYFTASIEYRLSVGANLTDDQQLIRAHVSRRHGDT